MKTNEMYQLDRTDIGRRFFGPKLVGTASQTKQHLFDEMSMTIDLTK